ncbi:zinc finger protein RFP-like [Trachemys scripta elegans]|uniref:zinc finger protein RFP-like n=1 Tax=Trachemys scripta elegans TaxID=31138 RepID=UPI001553C4E0|nr:zinc finger protein RFP-like [Trachemys scripta elegans]
MAAESPAESLQDELSCPICLEYFKDPVIIECGHNFCRACISQCWGETEPNFSCPQCRETAQQRNLRPNRQLGKVVELVKGLRLQAVTECDGQRVCERHQEALKLFCEEDQTPICVVCDKSKAHRSHKVVPIEEAAQEYKEQLQTRLQALKEEREKLQGWKLTGEKRSPEYLGKTEAEREKIVAQFKKLHQFLEEEEQLLLARLGELEKEIVKLQDENITKLSAEISRLSELISEMEGKCQQPASEFLQDVRSTLSRCQQGKFQQLVEISPDLAKRLGDFTQKNIVLKETLKKFQDALMFELQTAMTLDPDTAHPELVLSADRKSVRLGDTQQRVPNDPERFDCNRWVLACEGFTSGRHCWEVEMGDGQCWAVGVARESVNRKRGLSFNPEEGIWAVQWLHGDQYQARTSPETTVSLGRVPSRIRVCLDCDEGQVAFFSADNKAPIFTFPPASFNGERIRPWFCFWDSETQLRLCS